MTNDSAVALSTTEVYSQELQATVTPPSSESENLMRKVPTSLAFRNSSASCRDTNPSRALDRGTCDNFAGNFS